jgi:hypothetical protein
VLPFELFDTVEPPSAAGGVASRGQFPLYVAPGSAEALLSWLLRLAARLGVSLRALATAFFDMEDRPVAPNEWCRPHPWLLMRISQRTGVAVSQLRQMTFTDFEPVYRDDEANGRFVGRRFDNRGVESRGYRFAVCSACLRSDPKPYLRREWLIGWMAVCPDHGTILLERCRACRKTLQFRPFGSRVPFSPQQCTSCNATLLDPPDHPALPVVVCLQAALLTAKSQGKAQLDGLGPITWSEMVALIDVLCGTVWTDLTLTEQEKLWAHYTEAFRHGPWEPTDVYGSRHDSLCFLAWLLQGWPDGTGPANSGQLLTRWLLAERNRLCRHLRSPWADPWTVGPSNFGPAILDRLRVLAGGSPP